VALTPAEKERARYHLGYGSLSPAAAISFGLPALIQPLFIIEQTLTLVDQNSEDRIRRMLKIMDDIECRLVDAQPALAAAKLGELEPRENHPDLLEKEYFRWACRLSDTLRAPLYPYSARFRQFMTGMAGSIPIRD
jgi:hypothetical protein